MAISYQNIVAGTSSANADTGSQLAQKINSNFAETKIAIEALQNGVPQFINIVLDKDNWGATTKTQTIINANIVSANCNTYAPLTPDNGSTSSNVSTTNYDAYMSCGVRAIFEGNGSVIFKVDTIPLVDIAVVVKVEVLEQ